jgi:polyphosphate kinase 2 (PPK2 family)
MPKKKSSRTNQPKVAGKKWGRKELRPSWRRCRRSWWPCRNGSRRPARRSASCSRDGTRQARGGTIKRIVERVSPRVFRVVALPAPTEREKSQMYLQRYVPHLPAAGEVIIFDRSWYNRAGVERVMFCTPEMVTRFLQTAPGVEQAMVDSGIILIKYRLEVSADEQTRRLKGRIDDPRKIWNCRTWT